MNRKKILILLGSLFLVLVLAACASSKNPLSETPPSESPSSKRDIVRIDALSSGMGGSAYALTFALEDIVNKNHPWIRVSAMESTGATENVRLMIDQPERRDRTLFFGIELTNHFARQGVAPYNKPYTTAGGVALFQASPWVLVTNDPNIKTPADLVGKRVNLHAKGSTFDNIIPALLEVGWGVPRDKVKYEYLGMGGGMQALGDGLIDATVGVTSAAPFWSPMPALQELMATRDVYFLDFGEEAIKKVEQKFGYPVVRGMVTVPSGSYGSTQTKEIKLIAEYLGWYVDLKMDEDKVYELTKIIYENAQKFGDYHAVGKGMTKETVSGLDISEKMFHPGAVKFYKEVGAKIGL